MRQSRDHKRARRGSMNKLLLSAIVAGSLLQGAEAIPSPALSKWMPAPPPPLDGKPRPGGSSAPSIPSRSTPTADDWEGQIPLVVTNTCDGKIWPGIATQSGTGPGTGGFELKAGESKHLWVSEDWQGRIWGRTNCTVNGDSCACKTGDCFSKLDCEFSGATPATLAEFNLAGGVDGMQTFYDISLVDGYNIPMGIKYLPSKNTSFVPPNLTNAACVATAGWLGDMAATGTFYSNSTFPIPLEPRITNKSVRNWCPWPYLAFPPTKPGSGVFPYPDDNVVRPEFSPCNSACAATGKDKDCCVGKYHDPDICKPSDYSKAVKAMCPDAYSFAFDDQKSTFIIPKGGGWEVVMCPAGRSTNILRQLGSELSELGNSGKLSELTKRRLSNVTYIESDKDESAGGRPMMSLAAAAVAVVAWLVL